MKRTILLRLRKLKKNKLVYYLPVNPEINANYDKFLKIYNLKIKNTKKQVYFFDLDIHLAGSLDNSKL